MIETPDFSFWQRGRLHGDRKEEVGGKSWYDEFMIITGRGKIRSGSDGI